MNVISQTDGVAKGMFAIPFLLVSDEKEGPVLRRVEGKSKGKMIMGAKG